MNAAFRGMVFLLPLLSMFVWGQGEETKVRLSGTVVDHSVVGIVNYRIALYEIGRDDPTAEFHLKNGGGFEFFVRRNRSYRLVTESPGFTPKTVEVRLDEDMRVPPIELHVKDAGEGPVRLDDGDGIQLQFKNALTAADLSRQAELMSLPLIRSAIDSRLLFPPLEFQPKTEAPQK